MKFRLFTILITSLHICFASSESRQYTNPAFMAAGAFSAESGDCDTRHPPFSSFKAALALMGFDAGILESKDMPKWPFSQEYEKNFGSFYTREFGERLHWCEDTTPAAFMKNSVLWFSHQITQRLGAEKFQEYLSRLNYGNQDATGTPGKSDGLINSWLGTSLKISVREQCDFILKLTENTLKFSKDAQEKTKEIMDREEDWDGWKLYGKTGSGDHDGWFIGWVEKDGKKIAFAQHVVKDPSLNGGGLMAKEAAKENIIKLLSR